MKNLVELWEQYKVIFSLIGGAIFSFFAFYYAGKRSEIELLVLPERHRKMHDTFILVCTLLLAGFLNYVFGILGGAVLDTSFLKGMFVFSLLLLVLALLLSLHKDIDEKYIASLEEKHWHKNLNKKAIIWFSKITEDQTNSYAMTVVALVFLVGAGSVFVFYYNSLIFCSVEEHKEIFNDLIKSGDVIELCKTVGIKTPAKICLGITIFESLLITLLLLSISHSKSNIQVTMYDENNDSMYKGRLYVYTRVGKRLMCGDSPILRRSYKNIYFISLDDFFENPKNKFNYVVLDEDKKKTKSEKDIVEEKIEKKDDDKPEAKAEEHSA